MSRLDTGIDVVEVYPEVEVDNGYGGTERVPSDVATRVNGWMQPVSSDEAIAAGTQVSATYRFIARDVPGGAWARVVFDGREFTVVGEPLRHNGSVRVRHAEVLLRAREPEVMP